MTDRRAQIQLARIQDDAWLWSTLVSQLAEENAAEGVKAMLSGATRGAPGSKVKDKAVEMIAATLPKAAASDLKMAMDAAVTAAIYSKPDSAERQTATAFIVANLENLSRIDNQMAVDNSNFALRWAEPGSEIEREAARVWNRLSVNHPTDEAETAYNESDILGAAPISPTKARTA